MTYEEYVLTKTNRYVYRGESEDDLENILKKTYGCENRNRNQNSKYSPVKPSAGTIFVGENMNKGWIVNKKAFCGWNIQFTKGIYTKDIKFK